MQFLALMGALLSYGSDAPTSVIVALVAVAVVSELLTGRLDKRAGAARERLFEEWAQKRGLEIDPDPIAEPQDFQLLQERSLRITRAAATSDRRIALLEWSYSTGSSSGRSLRLTGLLIRAGVKGSHVLMRPVGKVRLPQLPGTPPEIETGHPDVDDSFEVTLQGGGEPDWVTAEVAAGLTALRARDASIEARRGLVLVKCLQLDPDEWDGLLADGERLAAALARVADS